MIVPPTRCVVRRGVTLLEIILAMGLLVLLTSLTYWFYGSSLQSRQRGTLEAQRLRLVRAVLDRMGTEIRQASVITAEGRVGLRGEAERLWLSTLRLPSRDTVEELDNLRAQTAGEFDLVKVEYKIVRHPDILTDDGYERPLGLARVEITVPRADSAQLGVASKGRARTVESGRTEAAPGGGENNDNAAEFDPLIDEARLDAEFFGTQVDGNVLNPEDEIAWEELYAPEIVYLRFCYFDGNRWWDDWDVRGENPLPQLVQATIGFKPHPPFDTEFADDDVREFCLCQNRDPSDCPPLPAGEYTAVIRIPQADPLFRSRMTRETQDFAQRLQEGGGTR